MSRELLREQEALQAAADAVYDDLGLAAALAEIGAPTRVGGVALGVMVTHDLDIDVACAALDDRAFAGITRLGAGLLRHPRVRQVQIRDDTEGVERRSAVSRRCLSRCAVSMPGRERLESGHLVH
ncbi:hypothetical protein [Spongiactinospora gelatinilytica]|uniref:hypothetical protein n=1 Tax=Spongiactinospora gelatinilytica TaxID=2666298 RepID=UPI0018F42435|nr:hypothetical protein [Spongiactinospora gelatinilytica]